MSKYKSKQKNKVVRVFTSSAPVFSYTSVCHSAPATKKPCAKGNGEVDDQGFYQSPLGTWNCSVCRKPCKVTRSKAKKEPLLMLAPEESSGDPRAQI